MRRILRAAWELSVVLLALPMFLYPQQPRDPFSSAVVKHGEEVFLTTCTFCHGQAGAGGSAPALSGRGLNAQYIDRIIEYGVPETAMTAWGQRLMAPDLLAVSSYVKSLNGIVPPPSANALQALSGDAARGRDLFFDPHKELEGCSNCHSINGRGVRLAPEIGNLPADAAGLRNLATPQLRTAIVGAETLPVIVVTQLRDETRLYDLTTVPPVLRMFPSASVKLTAGSAWQHSAVVKAYSDQELDLILAFLRATVPAH